uniref:Uncharacterized protein n=1 Tax=Arundo donax TaxID=35708 RepID=A0A0A9H7P2_ARUDO
MRLLVCRDYGTATTNNAQMCTNMMGHPHTRKIK